MQTHRSRRFIVLLELSLALLLSSCGVTSAQPALTHVHPTSTTAPKPTATPETTAQQLSLNQAASADIGGLHVSSDGVQCESWIVLKDEHATYDVGSLSQLKDYLGKEVFSDDGVHVILNLPGPLPAAPSSADVVLGSMGNEFDTDNSYSVRIYQVEPMNRFGCATVLTLTNTSQDSIQLSKMGVTYLSASTTNNFAYHLVDYCTVESCGPCPCGAGLNCTLFSSLTLSSGPLGKEVDAPIVVDTSDSCIGSGRVQPTLTPGQSVVILLELRSVDASQIYHLGLAADIVTSTGSRRLTFPSVFNSNVAFASRSQFSCFGLHGNTFTREASAVKPSCI